MKKFLFIMLLLLLATTARAKMELGMNMNYLADWGDEWIFTDVMKISREWLTTRVGTYNWDDGFSSEIPLAANGWPLHSPFTASDGNQYFMHTLMPCYVPGTYTVIVEGTGEILFWGAGIQHVVFEPEGGTNTYTLNTTAGEGDLIFLEIYESSASDPIRNIRVIMPGFASTYATQVFHPLFLERLNGFTCLRFMNWQKVNEAYNMGTTVTAFSYYTQAGDMGIAPEYMAALCNTVNADAWICIPHLADDDYVREMAQRLEAALDPGRKVYVEYSNETWNFAPAYYPQYSHCRDQGYALGLSNEEFFAVQFYTSHRSAEIWRIFLDEFDDDSQVVKTLCTQVGYYWVTENRIRYLRNPANNPDNIQPDVIGIAPYFGPVFYAADIPPQAAAYPTVYQILEKDAKAAIQDSLEYAEYLRTVTDLYGYKLACYESGQHIVGVGEAMNDENLTDILIQANRDQRMYNRYVEYLTGLDAAGVDLMCHYLYVGGFSRYGSWASLETQDQPVSQAPKYRALLDFMQGNFNLVPDGMLLRDVENIMQDRNILVFPNPASTGVHFVWKDTEVKDVLINIFNMAGERVGHVRQGGDVYPAVWDATDVAPGVYVYQIMLIKNNNTTAKYSGKLAVSK